MPYIQTASAKLFYQSYGKGEPIVCISGYCSDHQFWKLYTEKLSKQYQVIVFDNRAVGQTKDDGGLLSVQLMADDVAALISKLKLDKPHIIGMSMGGTIAQCLAANHPELINKLVLISTTAKWRKVILFAFAATLKLRASNFSPDTQLDLVFSWVMGDNFLKDSDNMDQLKKDLLSNQYPQSLEDQRRQYAALEIFDGNDQLTKIKAKTLIAHGEEDIIALPREGRHLADNIKDSTLVEFSCGHNIPLEMPQELLDLLFDFFKS